jgi:ferredoxin
VTDAELEYLEGLHRAATKNEEHWGWGTVTGQHLVSTGGDLAVFPSAATARFAAQAHVSLPRLVAALRGAREAMDARHAQWDRERQVYDLANGPGRACSMLAARLVATEAELDKTKAELRALRLEFLTVTGQCTEEHHWKGNCPAEAVLRETRRTEEYCPGCGRQRSRFGPDCTYDCPVDAVLKASEVDKEEK